MKGAHIMFKRISLVALVCLSLAATPVQTPKTAAPTKTGQPAGLKHPALAHALANTHLHGAKPAVSQVAKASTHQTLAKHWRHRWSFAEWATVHRGTGTIMGEVRSKSGSAVGGAVVRLKKANGASFRSAAAKHIVHTNSSGTFVMRHVRIGSYRVRADKAKANGHVGIHLHGGVTATANVRI